MTKSSRMRGESDGLSRNGRGSLCTQSVRALWVLPGRATGSAPRRLRAQLSARPGGWASAGSGRGRGRWWPRSSAPPSFRFWAAAADWLRVSGPAPGTPPPRQPRPSLPPRPQRRSWGMGGGGRADPAAEARRREKRPKEEGEREGERGSGERERAEAACRRRGGVGRGRGGAGRGAGEAGTRGARTSPQSANFPGESAGRAPSGRGEKSAGI